MKEKLLLMESDHKRGRELILSRTTIPASDLDDMFHHGRVLTVDEALEYGVIHGVAEYPSTEQGEGGKASPATS